MASRHLVARAADARFQPPEPLTGPSTGFERWPVIDDATPGAVHTGFDVCRLAAGGTVASRVAAYEQSIFLLDGEVVLQTGEGATRLRPGDYGLIPVGVPYSWRNESAAPARWAQMLAPQPRARHGGDSTPVPELPATAAAPVDPRDPRTRRYGHIEAANMDVRQQSQERLAVSASMRTALLVYSGISVKMMVDSDLGADLTTMFMVHYDPAGVAGPHDHPFEETYLFLEGRAEGTFDGTAYELGPGDVAFAGVGCVHSFRNLTDGPLRWLETQAPQPPARHSYRFRRDWDYLTDNVKEQ
ncbi:cupin domain-containing protein [Natronosporangium hydrolyticum]|uniref:Cupin domain-containing protein n=1 Tax=Natronosporangium hydrolyticum TaxID=2811111 RepID=A0A895Y7D5_9ACTN|nr:cupin domain-containing protein [Natronosporangium hydrolyticum]QSB13627.1 cupin domain-containing protein [Natronosporangium hydrolyticum]